ncbi:energy transducer TonB [Solimonas sp. K1W22B-7]|uniref:energy transducer TonB family protein n=1 Tax=Solimonas sp. K1W22B-7 TaxID=2303331 RepID=UPI000E3315E0|nr:energy transducer TonB [Solimonas sp. K1W22B-7]AXQ30357.1 energy transducer TonB [Solimonas sp. K1W22B-7]
MASADHRKGKKRRRPLAVWLVGAVGLALLVGVVLMLTGKKDTPKKAVSSVVQLKLLTPPPPPPPPPPPKPEEKVVEEKTPQPEMKVEELDTKPPSEDPPSDEPPGPPALDAVGEGAGDGFGLAGKPGGSGYGNGGGGGGTRFGWYYSKVHDRVLQAMERRNRLKDKKHDVTAQVWLDAAGRVERVKLVGSTGESDLDQMILDTLRSMAQIDEPPPGDMPQPVNVRLGARNRAIRFKG